MYHLLFLIYHKSKQQEMIRFGYKVVTKVDWATQRPMFHGTVNEVKQNRIHLSHWYQLHDTLQRKFKPRDDLILLTVDLDVLASNVRYHKGYPNVVDSPLTKESILWTRDLILVENGFLLFYPS